MGCHRKWRTHNIKTISRYILLFVGILLCGPLFFNDCYHKSAENEDYSIFDDDIESEHTSDGEERQSGSLFSGSL
ncbi:hypothetical protein Y032_0241g3388 [Ancylostoma ceylanicum]|uniref:Uncharacterized protein n=1 Tax=Ancylostoma ceylanicum TaxID=53326 RepID=A0A016SEJ5_9BILA|nr:hypothetical protein Y032_0241g3388 [Ancylostoma ceylanicum]